MTVVLKLCRSEKCQTHMLVIIDGHVMMRHDNGDKIIHVWSIGKWMCRTESLFNRNCKGDILYVDYSPLNIMPNCMVIAPFFCLSTDE